MENEWQGPLVSEKTGEKRKKNGREEEKIYKRIGRGMNDIRGRERKKEGKKKGNLY